MQVSEQAERINEIEMEAELERSKLQTEIIKLTDQNETLQSRLDAMPDVENIQTDRRNAQFSASESIAQADRLKEEYQQQLVQKQEEITELAGQLAFKDDYIRELEEQNDELSG